MIIKIKRGKEATRKGNTFELGEPVLVTDTKRLYIGDGVTPGGFSVGTMYPEASVAADMIAVFKDSEGRAVKGLTKAELLKGYPTLTEVNNRIALAVPDIKVKNAVRADLASNAQRLNGYTDYIRQSNVSDSISSTSSVTVASSKAVKAAYDAVVNLINGVKSTVTALTSRVNAISKKLDTTATTASSAATQAAQVSSSFHTHLGEFNRVSVRLFNSEQHLKYLPGRVSSGQATPAGGADGDVYIQYS